MDNIFQFLYNLWDVICGFEIYGISIVPFTFSIIGVIVGIRVLMNFLK